MYLITSYKRNAAVGESAIVKKAEAAIVVFNEFMATPDRVIKVYQMTWIRKGHYKHQLVSRGFS